MAEVTIRVNGRDVQAPAEAMLAAVLMKEGCRFRSSVTGRPRQALCAMGTCFECRITVDGVPHVPACRVLVRDGMVVETGG